MHGAIREVASHIVGIDLDEEAVSKVQLDGTKSLIFGDAREITLDSTFDVVHAGELIEHLDDFRSFLTGVRRHLDPDGVLVVTTPNVFCISNFVYRLGGNPRVNKDHMCWFCEDTLRQLFERNDYSVVHLTYLGHETPSPIRAMVASSVRALMPPRLKWNTILAVAKPR